MEPEIMKVELEVVVTQEDIVEHYGRDIERT